MLKKGNKEPNRENVFKCKEKHRRWSSSAWRWHPLEEAFRGGDHGGSRGGFRILPVMGNPAQTAGEPCQPEAELLGTELRVPSEGIQGRRCDLSWINGPKNLDYSKECKSQAVVSRMRNPAEQPTAGRR